jgi:uncharacterized protein YggE
MENRHMQFPLPAVLAAAALATTAVTARAQTPPDPHGMMMAAHGPLLNLSAYGETHAAPDMATISLGVTVQAPTAVEAMRQNASKMAGLMSALKRQGVPEKDIQTSGLNLAPQYVFKDGVPPQLTGYQASNQVTVTVRDLSRLGVTVDAVVAGGSNEVSGISFGLRDPQTAQDAARLEAVDRLNAQAALYAKATGHRLKGLRSLTESGGYEPSPIRPMMMRAAAAPSVETSIQPGQLDLRVDVQATFELE